MESPNHVIQFFEERREPENPQALSHKVLKLGWMIPVLALLFSLLLQQNMFAIFGLPVWLVYLGGMFMVKSKCKHIQRPSPLEIQLYDDYLIVYSERRYYDAKVTRKEYNKFYYKDIKRIHHRKLLRKIFIYGIQEGIWYNYTKQGVPQKDPSYHKTTDSGCYFYVVQEELQDVLNQMQQYCPVKIEITED